MKPYQRHIPETEDIPPELARLPIWCAWELVEKPGAKPDKRPISPKHGGRKGWAAHRDTFCTTLEEAIDYASPRKGINGVGVILTERDGIAGGDLDGGRDSATGEISEEHRHIIEEADTYTEVSPGLSGFRFLAFGAFGGHTGNDKPRGVELYEGGRFLTITGWHLEETPFAIEERDLSDLGRYYFPEKPAKLGTQSAITPDMEATIEGANVPAKARQWLREGFDEGADRSTEVWRLAKDLIRAGISQEQALGLILSGPAADCALERRNGDFDAAADWLSRYAIQPAAAEVAAEPNPAEDFASLEAGDWPDLAPLEAPSPARLPVEKWPRVLREYAEEATKATETPIELPAMMALSVVATATQRLADLEVKPGYREPLSLFAATIMPPATRKSAEVKRALRPLVDFEARKRKELEGEIRRATARRETMEKRLAEKRKEAQKAEDEETAMAIAEEVAQAEAELPEIPRPPRTFSSDVTPEHLGTMMANHGESMAILSAEGGIFETIAGRYSANGAANMDLFLSSHAGEAVRVDRGSKEPEILDNPRLTMGLAIQPDVITQMTGKREFKGRGMVGRFLYVYPPDNLGSRTGETETPDPFVQASYEQTVTALLEAREGREEEGKDVMRLSSSARDKWREFWRDVERELMPGGRFAECQDWGGKLPGAVARIAGLFHAVQATTALAETEVSGADMEAAIATGWALADHALYVFDMMGADEAVDGARAVVKWLRRSGLQTFHSRDAQRLNQRKFPKVADLEPALDELEARGYITQKSAAKQGGRGRPPREFAVNPKALA